MLEARPPLPATRAATAIAASLPYVCACSTFAADACVRDAGLLEWLATDAARLLDDADAASFIAWAEAGTTPGRGDDATFMAALRNFRRRHLVRIAWRDLCKHAPIDTVLRELTLLADACIGAACRHATATFAARHGFPSARDGAQLPLVVARHGQAGRRRAEFLVRHRPHLPVCGARAETVGPRPLDEEFFARVAKRVAQLLGTVTSDGFVYRVDLRLRPFGDSGPVAIDFDALQDYLQERPGLGALCVRQGTARARRRARVRDATPRRSGRPARAPPSARAPRSRSGSAPNGPLLWRSRGPAGPP